MAESLEREGQMRSAPRLYHRMDLVHDYGPDRSQHLPAPPSGQEQVERLGGCHQDVRWFPQHGRTLGGRGVTRSDGGSDPGSLETRFLCQAADLSPGFGQIQVNVGAESLERRDVD